MSKSSLVTGTVYITFSTAIFVVSSYLVNIFLGRILGPASYGTYGIVISLMTLINLMQTTGLPLAVSKFTAEDETESDMILKSGLILQLISTGTASLVFFLLAGSIAKVLHDPTLTPYLQAVSAVFPIYGIYSIYLNYYNGLHHFKTQALMSIVYSIVKLFSIILFVYLFKVFGAIFGFIVSPLIALLIWFHFPKTLGRNYVFKKIINFSIPLIAIAILSNLLQSIDLFIVKSLLHSDKLTGYYTANQNIAELPFYGVTALLSVLFPSISRSVNQKLHHETKSIISKSIRFSLFILTPSVLLISATSSKILTFLYSASYAPGAESLSILAIGSGFFTFFVLFTTIISGSGSPYKSALLTIIGLAITSISCITLVPAFGLNGASLSTLLGAATSMIIALYLVYKKFNTLIPLLSFIKIITSSLIIYAIAILIPVSSFILPFWYLALFIIYFILLIVLKELNYEDLQIVKKLLPSQIIKKINI